MYMFVHMCIQVHVHVYIMYIHVHNCMETHVCTMFRHICTDLPILVQVVRIPDVPVGDQEYCIPCATMAIGHKRPLSLAAAATAAEAAVS